MKGNSVLRTKKDFNNLFKNKSTYYSSFFIVYFVKNNFNYFRYAIIVNKKNFKKAVDRNKIKRQIRFIMSSLKNKKMSIDFLIIPKNNYLTSDFIVKKNDLLNLIAKIYLKTKNKIEEEV